MHFLHHCTEHEYNDLMIKNVNELYGSGEDNVGPFSVKIYLEYIV